MIGRRQRFAHRAGVERAGALQRVRPYHDGGRRLRGLVGRRIAVLALEQRGVIGGAAEQVVAVGQRRRPLCGAQNALGSVTEPRRVGHLGGFAVGDGQYGGRHPQLRGLAYHQCRTLRMARYQQHVGEQRLYLEQGRGHVVEVARQLVVDHHLHTEVRGGVERAGADILGKRIVLGSDRDLELGRISPLRLRLFGRQVDRLLQVLLGSGQHREQVAVALVEQLPRSAVTLNHRHLVPFGDRSDRLSQTRAVGAEHEPNPVLPDQPLGQLRTARRRRLVVVVQNLQAVVLARDAHAAALVDHLDREVVTLAGVVARGGVLAGERHRRTEHDGSAADSREPGCRQQQQGGGQQQHRTRSRRAPTDTCDAAIQVGPLLYKRRVPGINDGVTVRPAGAAP